MQFVYHPAMTSLSDTIHLSDHESYVRRITDEYGTPIALVLSNPEREIESQQEDEQSQGERIAKLLAAAPALLQALLHIDSNAAESVEWIRRVAREAIAKTVN